MLSLASFSFLHMIEKEILFILYPSLNLQRPPMPFLIANLGQTEGKD